MIKSQTPDIRVGTKFKGKNSKPDRVTAIRRDGVELNGKRVITFAEAENSTVVEVEG